MLRHTLGQDRAAFALRQLEAINCDRDKFKKLCAGLPSMIMQNGFGQALAFLAAKGKTEHVAASTIMLQWLTEKRLLGPASLRQQLMQINTMDQGQYLLAQRESLAMLEWLKRYAHAALFE